jgi:bifunctional enzyme CysN/CysC
MGSVVYGVDADIHGHSDIKDRYEHVRRLAEIANIFLDAGIILIITAVELTKADLELFRVVVDSNAIVPIWVGNGETTDLAIDMQRVDIDPLENAVTQALGELQKNGFVIEIGDQIR